MAQATRQLLFVYNAKSGFMHGVMDLIHKSASPRTYPCKLCQMTYSGATMNKLWKHYVKSLGMPTIFLHRDEFGKSYPNQNFAFPVILLKEASRFRILISKDEFAKMSSLDDLISLLNQKLKAENK